MYLSKEEIHDIAMLYLGKGDFSDLSPVELAQKYVEARESISALVTKHMNKVAEDGIKYL